MADQSGVRNGGVEGRAVETPRYSPGRLMALRKSAINQITPPQKGETWAGLGGWLSRLPSVRLPESRRCHGQLAIVSLSPSMICKTAIVLPNRSGRFITYHMATNRSNSIIPAPAITPLTVRIATAEGVEILTRRDRCPASSTSSWADHTDNRHIPHGPPTPSSSYAHAFFLPSVASSLRCRALVGHDAHIAAGDAGCQPAHH